MKKKDEEDRIHSEVYGERQGDAAPQIVTLGDESILDLPKVGFLSSRKVPPAAVMKCYGTERGQI